MIYVKYVLLKSIYLACFCSLTHWPHYLFIFGQLTSMICCLCLTCWRKWSAVDLWPTDLYDLLFMFDLLTSMICWPLTYWLLWSAVDHWPTDLYDLLFMFDLLTWSAVDLWPTNLYDLLFMFDLLTSMITVDRWPLICCWPLTYWPLIYCWHLTYWPQWSAVDRWPSDSKTGCWPLTY